MHDLKQIIVLIAGLFCVQSLFSQSDSTDISFTAVAYQQQSLQDSLQYGTGELSELQLEFEIEDSLNFSKVWVEVISINAELTEEAIFYDSFTTAQLTAAGALTGNQVQLDMLILQLYFNYKVVVRIEDIQGHEIVSITKFLEA